MWSLRLKFAVLTKSWSVIQYVLFPLQLPVAWWILDQRIESPLFGRSRQPILGVYQIGNTCSRQPRIFLIPHYIFYCQIDFLISLQKKSCSLRICLGTKVLCNSMWEEFLEIYPNAIQCCLILMMCLVFLQRWFTGIGIFRDGYLYIRPWEIT